MLNHLLKWVPGFKNVHVLWYVKDTSIPSDDPRHQDNQLEAVFNTLFSLAWFVARDPVANAAEKAGRTRYLIIPREAYEQTSKIAKAA